MDVSCSCCGKDFNRKPSHIAKYNFCSQKCRSDYGRVLIQCDFCGADVRKKKSQIYSKNYCSIPCKLKDSSVSDEHKSKRKNKWKELNKEKIKEYQARYRKEHRKESVAREPKPPKPPKVIKGEKVFANGKCKYKYERTDDQRNKDREWYKALPDTAIRSILKLKKKDCPVGLIDALRFVMLIKREVRNEKRK